MPAVDGRDDVGAGVAEGALAAPPADARTRAPARRVPPPPVWTGVTTATET